MTARAAGSAAIVSSSAWIAAIIAVESTLKRSPRLSVSLTTPSSWAVRRTKGVSTTAALVVICCPPYRASLLDRVCCPGPLAKNVFLNLLGGCLGKRTENHRPGRLEVGEPSAAVLDQLCLRSVGA